MGGWVGSRRGRSSRNDRKQGTPIGRLDGMITELTYSGTHRSGAQPTLVIEKHEKTKKVHAKRFI